MKKQQPEQRSKEHSEAVNEDLEIALVKIARVLYEYVDAQNDAERITRINKLFREFENLAANYYEETGRLHPDLCYDFGEWATLKAEWLALPAERRNQPASEGVTPQFVAEYRSVSLGMIENLERELGIHSTE